MLTKRILITIWIFVHFIGISAFASEVVRLSSYGVTGDGIAYDNELFQKALDESQNKTLLVEKPLAAYLVGPLQIQSNTRIVLEKGTVIRAAIEKFSTNDCLFQIVEKENVAILGNDSTLEMPDVKTDGEWRHIINIKSSRNIAISSLNINNARGDGIYIGCIHKDGTPPFSQEITLESVSTQKALRHGLTIISAIGVLVRDCSFAESNGFHYSCGIDIEPHVHEKEVIKDIKLVNVSTSRNNSFGLLIHGKTKEVGIDVQNFQSYREKNTGIGLMGAKPTSSGTVLIRNAKCIEPYWHGIYITDWAPDSVVLKIDSPAITNINSAERPRIKGVVSGIYIHNKLSNTNGLGGITIIQPKVIDNRASSFTDHAIYALDQNEDTTIRNIFVLGTVYAPKLRQRESIHSNGIIKTMQRPDKIEYFSVE